MPTLDHADRRDRLNWLGPTTLLAAVPLLHFAISVGLWVMWWVRTLLNPWMRPRHFSEASIPLTCFASAFCLLVLSVITQWLALKRRRIAWRLLLVLVLIAVAVFWIDIHFHRYQISVDIASREYWDHGGLAHYYFTWWWYNDLWFR